MTPEQVRRIIQEELARFITSDKFVFSKHIQVLDGRNFQFATGTGTEFGTPTQKMGFYGATPVVQRPTFSGANTQGGAYNQTDVQSIANTANNTLAALQALGFIA